MTHQNSQASCRSVFQILALALTFLFLVVPSLSAAQHTVCSSGCDFNHATIKGGGWANVAATGTVSAQPSVFYSVNTASTDCSKY